MYQAAYVPALPTRCESLALGFRCPRAAPAVQHDAHCAVSLCPWGEAGAAGVGAGAGAAGVDVGAGMAAAAAVAGVGAAGAEHGPSVAED